MIYDIFKLLFIFYVGHYVILTLYHITSYILFTNNIGNKSWRSLEQSIGKHKSYHLMKMEMHTITWLFGLRKLRNPFNIFSNIYDINDIYRYYTYLSDYPSLESRKLNMIYHDINSSNNRLSLLFAIHRLLPDEIKNIISFNLPGVMNVFL